MPTPPLPACIPLCLPPSLSPLCDLSGNVSSSVDTPRTLQKHSWIASESAWSVVSPITPSTYWLCVITLPSPLPKYFMKCLTSFPSPCVAAHHASGCASLLYLSLYHGLLVSVWELAVCPVCKVKYADHRPGGTMERCKFCRRFHHTRCVPDISVLQVSGCSECAAAEDATSDSDRASGGGPNAPDVVSSSDGEHSDLDATAHATVEVEVDVYRT